MSFLFPANEVEEDRFQGEGPFGELIFDADGDFLDEKISFTFDDFHIAETFGAKKSKLDRMWRPVQ